MIAVESALAYLLNQRSDVRKWQILLQKSAAVDYAGVPLRWSGGFNAPYFMVVKPTLARGFNYKDMHWADLPQVHTAKVTLAPEIQGAIAEVAYA